MIFTLSLLMSTLKELSSTEYCSLYYNFRNSRTIEYLRFMKNEMNFYKKNHTGVIVTLGFFPPAVVYQYTGIPVYGIRVGGTVYYTYTNYRYTFLLKTKNMLNCPLFVVLISYLQCLNPQEECLLICLDSYPFFQKPQNRNAWKINKGIILQYWLKLISCNLQRSLSDSLLRRTAIIKGTFGSHSMSNYLQDSREEIIAIARGHGLPISAVTACNTSSVFAAGIISNSRYRTKRSAECHSFGNI